MTSVNFPYLRRQEHIESSGPMVTDAISHLAASKKAEMGYGIFQKTELFSPVFSKSRHVPSLHSTLRQPRREAGFFHDEHTGAVRLA